MREPQQPGHLGGVSPGLPHPAFPGQATISGVGNRLLRRRSWTTERSGPRMNRRQVLTYGAFGLGATALAPGLTWARSHASHRPVELDRITRIVIHPAIGIARVGNSPHEW